jgi:hypothetical protein
MRAEIPDYIKMNTLPDEVTAFSSTIEINFAILMLIIDKLAPIDDPQTVPTPTKIDSSVSQEIRILFSNLETISPYKMKALSEDAKKFMMSMPKLPQDIQVKFNERRDEIMPQVIYEARSELLKLTPQILVSYPIWPTIVKETMFSVGEMNAINILAFSAYASIFRPILEQVQGITYPLTMSVGELSSATDTPSATELSSTNSPKKTAKTTTQADTTTQVDTTTQAQTTTQADTTTQAQTTTQADTTTQAQTTTTKPKISLPPKLLSVLSRRTARQIATQKSKQRGGQQSTTTRTGPVVPIGSIPGKLW